jgi:hypothetical protein
MEVTSFAVEIGRGRGPALFIKVNYATGVKPTVSNTASASIVVRYSKNAFASSIFLETRITAAG